MCSTGLESSEKLREKRILIKSTKAVRIYLVHLLRKCYRMKCLSSSFFFLRKTKLQVTSQISLLLHYVMLIVFTNLFSLSLQKKSAQPSLKESLHVCALELGTQEKTWNGEEIKDKLSRYRRIFFIYSPAAVLLFLRKTNLLLACKHTYKFGAPCGGMMMMIAVNGGRENE